MKARQWRRSPAGKYLRHLPRIKHIRGTWLHRRLGDSLFRTEMWQPSRERFASGCSIGAFIGMLPIPFQMLAAALIAFLTRTNIPAAIALTWLSNPFTAAFFVYAHYKFGSFLMGRTSGEPTVGWLELLKMAPVPILVGSCAMGLILAVISYPIALVSWDWVTKHFLQPRRRASQEEGQK